jgi:purine-binding chemotaxis protein CheW
MSDTTTRPVASAAAARPMGGQYLTFGLAGEQFAIPILTVQEIRGWEPVARTPHAPRHVLGVMNLRGAVVPVLDLRTRLGMEPSERTSTSVVIVVRADTPSATAVTVGCLVDHVSDVVSLEVNAGTPPPSACGTVATHFLAGVATVERQLVMLLDLVRLVESTVCAPASEVAA